MIIRHETATCDCISLLHEIREVGPLRVGGLRWFCLRTELLLMLEIPYCSLILIIVIFEKYLVCCVKCLRLEQQQCCLSVDWSETTGGVHVIIGDVCQLREAFGSSRRQ